MFYVTVKLNNGPANGELIKNVSLNLGSIIFAYLTLLPAAFHQSVKNTCNIYCMFVCGCYGLNHASVIFGFWCALTLRIYWFG